MTRFRKCHIPLLLMLVLLIGASSAFGHPPIPTHDAVHETVSWTIPADQCPSLPAGLSVSGTGDRRTMINTKTNKDGSTQVVTNDVVQGDAVDSEGGTYHFTYTNHSIVVIPAESGLPIQVNMSDNFVLNGQGSAGHMTVGFEWRWTYTPPAEIWPPVDNWQQVSTRGEPLLCDPL